MSSDQKIAAHPHVSEQESHELVPGSAAIRGSITHAVVIKNRDLFFLSEPDGSVPLADGHGFGLYYHDCRFLNGYELKVAGRRPEVLVRNAERGYMATLGLSNPDLRVDERMLLKHSVEIRWERTVSSEHLGLFDTIALQNLTSEFIRFSLALTFQSGFEDIFAIRGLFQGERGTLEEPVWKKGALHFIYKGADAVHRELMVHFSPLPAQTEPNGVSYKVELQPKARQQLRISLIVSEVAQQQRAPRLRQPTRRSTTVNFSKNAENPWLKQRTEIRTDSLLLNRVLDRSLRDLEMLRSDLGNNITYFAAGVPWFVALFGRDSIITALQTLAYDSRIAEQTIRLLARYQGKEVNPWREEQPGKILHELRLGEMANLNEIPHTPYYGTIDATPLWLLLVGKHAAWTGDLRVFNELRTQIEAALNWIDHYGDADGDGYVEYDCKTDKGLANQGWKDSGDGIVNADGSLATPPIALVEVQGYVYEAKLEMAALYRRTADTVRAAALENEARQLRERFNRDFWVADGYYALALQNGKRLAAVLSSNTGHSLWSGIAEMARARQIADSLLSDEMFNGWGIRTLSAAALRYNPLGYHLGTVWPHDNSLIGAGFKRYGLDKAALRIMSGMIEAAFHFDAERLPELFGGFARNDYGVAVSYPVACQPQAWSAGAVPYLLTTNLGLQPDAFGEMLRIVRPMLPENINRVEIRRLAVGEADVDLLFERCGRHITMHVLNLNGKLEVVVES